MANFGDTLKRERELREISLREISDSTKINIRYLEALEQNRFEALPGGLFNKGFIRAYSTYIGVDGEAMVNCYLQEIASREGSGSAGAAEIPAGVHRPAESPRRRADPRDEPRGNGQPLKITFAAGQPPAVPAASTGSPSAQPFTPRASTDAGAVAGSKPRAPLEGAVTQIEEAGGAARPSRVLSGILLLVGAATVLFVVLSIALGRPSPRGQAGPPVAESAEAHTSRAAGPGPGAGTGPGDLSAASVAAAAPAGAAVETPKASEPPSAAARPGGKPSARASETGAGPMDLQIETTGTTWVQLFCDDREVINWVMKGGESQAMRCLRLVRVSAADAAAVRLTVNGAPCAPLGDPGSRVHGYTIRSDDFRQICPGASGGDDGRH